MPNPNPLDSGISRRQALRLAGAASIAAITAPRARAGSAVDNTSAAATDEVPQSIGGEFAIENDYPYFGPEPDGHARG
jgi:hypothetical protein